MTERQLRFKVRMQILENFHENKRTLVEGNLLSDSNSISLTELRLMVRQQLLKRLREAEEGKEVSDDSSEIADMFADKIDDQLASVMQKANALAKKSSGKSKKEGITLFTVMIALPAVVEIIGMIFKVIGKGVKFVVSKFTGEDEESKIEKIGDAIEHWAEHTLLEKGYYRIIGFVVKGLIEGTAKGIKKALDKMQGQTDPDAPDLGEVSGPIRSLADKLLEESAKTDYIKVGGWIFKAVSLAAVAAGLKEAVTNWHEITEQVSHAIHFAIEVFEAMKAAKSAAEILVAIIAAAGGTFAVFKVYKQISDKVGGMNKLNDIVTGKQEMAASAA